MPSLKKDDIIGQLSSGEYLLEYGEGGKIIVFDEKTDERSVLMRLYELQEGSYSYDLKNEEENFYTKEDVMCWADDVASMIEDESEEPAKISVETIEEALEVLNSANEFLVALK